MNFTIDQDSKTPIGEQIKDQVRYAVAVGELVPGDELPSIRDLEGRLAVHRNTVRKAFSELRDEGTLEMAQGRRAVVAKAVRTRNRPSSEELRDMMQEMLRGVESQGLDALCFAREFVREATRHDWDHAKFGFAECSEEQAADMALVVERLWGRRVLPFVIQDLDRAPVSSLRHVLTPHWHQAEVKRWSRGLGIKVHPVRVQLSSSCLERLRELRGARIGLVLRDPESISGYRELVRKKVGRPVSVDVALIGKSRSWNAWLGGLDAVVFTTSCRTQLLKRMGRSSRSRLSVVELVYEPIPRDLTGLLEDTFPWHGLDSQCLSSSSLPSP